MPSSASTCKNSDMPSWLRSAMALMAWLSSSSAMRMPMLSPICSWICSIIMRSSTCWRSTLSAGISTPFLRRLLLTSAMRCRYWLCMMMPSSTITAMRSSGCSAACNRPRHSTASSRPARKLKRFVLFTSLIALDAFVKEGIEFAGTGTAQPAENKLDKGATVSVYVVECHLVLLVMFQPVALDNAHTPAAAAIFYATKGVEGTPQVTIILPAAQNRPALVYRPHEGQVGLHDFVRVVDQAAGGVAALAHFPAPGVFVVVDTVITIAITDVEYLARIIFRLIVQHQAAGAGFFDVWIPGHVAGEAPVTAKAIHVLAGQRRSFAHVVVAAAIVLFGTGLQRISYVLRIHGYFAALEVVSLPNGHALAFKAVLFQPAISQAGTELVGITNAIAAAEPVVAKQAGIAEGAFAGIK